MKKVVSLLVLFLEAALLSTSIMAANSNFGRVVRATSAATAKITVPDDFPTIQQAINAANDGDTVFVKSGIYYEHVLVNKNISLIGQNWITTIIDGNGSLQSVVGLTHLVSANMSGFMIRNTPDWGLDFGTWISISSLPRIVTEVAFVNCHGAIERNGSLSCTLYHNTFINCTYDTYGDQPANMPSLFWNNSCEGSYWGPIYNGTDANKDGIGDTPFLNMSVGWDFYPLMSPYIKGDVNHDAVVNIYDAIILGLAYGKSSSSLHWNPHCDLNEDNQVNIYDALALAGNFNQHYP